MGSNYYGEAKFGGSSSRKGKNNSSDKPNKQPQRGLGVAQLEKIRLHTQLGSANPLPNPNYPFTNPIQVYICSSNVLNFFDYMMY